MISLTILMPQGLELRPENFMLDLVSTISNVLLGNISFRAVITTPRGMDLGVIMSSNTLLIVAWLSLYSFDGGPMG